MQDALGLYPIVSPRWWAKGFNFENEVSNMTANIKEIHDGGPNPNTPTVAEMRESQRKGRVGTGTQTDTYGQQVGWFNMGTGEGGAGDKPSFPTPSNDPDVAECE
jgi:hypothetical protein